MIKASKKPMFIAGGGVRYSEAGQTAMDFCKTFNISGFSDPGRPFLPGFV